MRLGKPPSLSLKPRSSFTSVFMMTGHTDATLKSGAEKLLRGVNSIIAGVVEIRNAHGAAAHGSDAYEPMLDARYAEILARATDAVIGILFKTHLNRSGKAPLARLRYGDHKDFDDWIDSDFGSFEVLETPLVASEALFRTDVEAYRTALVVFKQEQEAARAEYPDDAEGET